jgi:D-alanyl-D-alanine carboxypeptidase (penicillin-binding protein 5/6)
MKLDRMTRMIWKRSALTALIVISLIVALPVAPIVAATLPTPTSATSESQEQLLVENGAPLELAPVLASHAAVLMDADSGQILYGKNMDERLCPASITKILTALVALEQGELTDLITLSYDAVFSIERGSSHIALDKDEQISLENALYALAIASANDAANGIAEYIGGSIDGFVELMNARAIAAGATNSHFENPHGLPNPQHLTTARDMALIMRAALQVPGFTRYFGTGRYDIPPTNLKDMPRELYSYNSFLNGERQLEGIVATKTGYTNEALHTLVTAASRNGRTLIAVVMKSSLKSEKWNDTEALMDYGFTQFRPVTIAASELPQAVIDLEPLDGKKRTAALAVSESIQLWLHQSVKAEDVERTLMRPDSLSEEDLERTTMVLTLGGQFSDRMATDLVTLTIQPVIMVDSAAEPVHQQTAAAATSDEVQGQPGWLNTLLILLLLFGLVLVAGIIYAIRRRELKRQRRRERLAMLRREFQEGKPRYL